MYILALLQFVFNNIMKSNRPLKKYNMVPAILVYI